MILECRWCWSYKVTDDGFCARCKKVSENMGMEFQKRKKEQQTLKEHLDVMKEFQPWNKEGEKNE